MLLDLADDLDADDLRAADALSEVRRSSRELAKAIHERGWGEVYLGLEIGADAPTPVVPEQDVSSDEVEWEAVDSDSVPDAVVHDWTSETDPDDVAQILDLSVPGNGQSLEDSADDGMPLPPGTRVTYQARFDFVVTEPDRLIGHLRDRVQVEGYLAGDAGHLAGETGGAMEASADAVEDAGGAEATPAHAAAGHRAASVPADIVEAVGLLAYYDGLGSREYDGIGLEFAGGHEVVRPIETALWEMSLTYQDDTFPFE